MATEVQPIRPHEDRADVAAPPVTTSASPARGPWRPRWTALVAAAALIALGALIRTRLAGQGGLPEGLIQVNGRLEGDLVSVSSKYNGRIYRLLAREGATVRAGQLVVSLADPETQARLDQAVANARSSEAQERGAAVGVRLTFDTARAQLLQAQGVVGQAASGEASAAAELKRARAAVAAALSSTASADAAIAVATAAVQGAEAHRRSAEAAVRSAEGQIDSAEAAAQAAEEAANSAQASSDRAGRDRDRYAGLHKLGAVSDQTNDQMEFAAQGSLAQLRAARRQADGARANLTSRRSEAEGAREEVVSAQAAVAQAYGQIAAARGNAAAAHQSVRQAEAVAQEALHALAQARQRRVQAEGQLRQAATAPEQVAVSESSRAQAAAKSAQARASVVEMRNTLRAMDVVAPVSGVVTTRYRDVGEVVTPGAPLLDVVDLDRLYLRVFVPVNQLGRVRLGLPARIYVDAFPRTSYNAVVTFISSTAEFTPKEVQTPDERTKLVYAVKLSLVSNPDHRLLPGVPADAVIRWQPKVPWQRPRW